MTRDCAGSHRPVPLPPQVQHLHAHYLCQVFQAHHLCVHPCSINLYQPDDLQAANSTRRCTEFPGLSCSYLRGPRDSCDTMRALQAEHLGAQAAAPQVGKCVQWTQLE